MVVGIKDAVGHSFIFFMIFIHDIIHDFTHIHSFFPPSIYCSILLPLFFMLRPFRLSGFHCILTCEEIKCFAFRITDKSEP